MASNKELAGSQISNSINSGPVIRLCQHSKLWHLFNILFADFSMTGMRNIKLIIKALEQPLILSAYMMLIYTKNFWCHIILRNTIMVVKACQRSPADMEGRENISLAPLHNFSNLLPVCHILIFQLLHRCTSDNKAIIFLMTNIGKGYIKFIKIIR